MPLSAPFMIACRSSWSRAISEPGSGAPAASSCFDRRRTTPYACGPCHGGSNPPAAAATIPPSPLKGVPDPPPPPPPPCGGGGGGGGTSTPPPRRRGVEGQ